MIKLFSLPCCPRCDIVETYLNEHGINHDHLMMDSAEGITELRVAGCFAMEAPVLMNEDVFLESATMFPDGKFNEDIVDGLVKSQ